MIIKLNCVNRETCCFGPTPRQASRSMKSEWMPLVYEVALYLRRRPNWFLYSSRAWRANSGSTRPLWGSVPRGRRNKRMCGSGLHMVMFEFQRERKTTVDEVCLSRQCVAIRIRDHCLVFWEQNYSPVNSIVLPSAALLNANTTPFRFSQETRFW